MKYDVFYYNAPHTIVHQLKSVTVKLMIHLNYINNLIVTQKQSAYEHTFTDP